jgi:hypothetical protein
VGSKEERLELETTYGRVGSEEKRLTLGHTQEEAE